MYTLQVYNSQAENPFSTIKKFVTKEEADSFFKNAKNSWFINFISSKVTRKGNYILEAIISSGKNSEDAPKSEHFSFLNNYRVLKMQKIENTNTWHAIYEFHEGVN